MIVCWPATLMPSVLPKIAWWRSRPGAPPGSLPASDQTAWRTGPALLVRPRRAGPHRVDGEHEAVGVRPFAQCGLGPLQPRDRLALVHG